MRHTTVKQTNKRWDLNGTTLPCLSIVTGIDSHALSDIIRTAKARGREVWDERNATELADVGNVAAYLHIHTGSLCFIPSVDAKALLAEGVERICISDLLELV